MFVFALIIAASLFLAFGHDHRHEEPSPVSVSGKWTCSMCPQFILPEMGKCPKCFMDLIPLQEGAGAGGQTNLVIPYETAQLAGIVPGIAESIDEQDAGPYLAVPATAALYNLGRTFVFVESDNGEYLTYSLREIIAGQRRGDHVEVVDGLYEGEAVVVQGAFRIDSAMQILGKISLTNLPDGSLESVDKQEPFQPAERSKRDLRAQGLRLDEWFRDYEAIRAALAKDDEPATAQPGGALLAALADSGTRLDPEFAPLHKQLSGDAQALSQAGGLDEKRVAFEKISAGMVLLARRYGSPAGGLRLIFCPMAFGGAGGHWLQPMETVDNPYHGLEMPLCGWQVDDITE